MENAIIDRNASIKLMEEALKEVERIKALARDYCYLIGMENEEANLFFIKVLEDMFSDGTSNGIGEQAARLEKLCKQVDEAIDDYFNENEQTVCD